MAGTPKKTRLNAIVRPGNGWTAVRLTGVIDEHNGLRQLTDRLSTPLLLVDLSGIARINSVGVRDWVTWLSDLKKRGVRPVLFDCPPGIMEQVNLVRNFAAGCTIETFFAPYYCDTCDTEENYSLDTFELLAAETRLAPEFKCDRTDCKMALDDVEENYFAFLEDQRVPSDLSELRLATKAARRLLDEAGAETTSLVSDRPSGGFLPDAPGAPSAVAVLAGNSPPVVVSGHGDMLFVLVVAIMTGLLGFIVYLILGLE